MEEHVDQESTLRTLWENPNQQLRRSTMKKEVLYATISNLICTQYEDSGYLSMFGGISSHQRQEISGMFSVRYYIFLLQFPDSILLA